MRDSSRETQRFWMRVDERSTSLVLLLALFAGCASVDPGPDFERARTLIQSSTGHSEVYAPDHPALEPSEIESVLADGLALSEALRLALLNNRRLQAQFMTLGIARADLVQAGLLSNPSLSLLFLLPSGGGRTNVQAGLAQSVSDLWQIPARKRVAAAGLEVRLLEVSRFAAILVADTRQSYYDSVAARDAVALARASSVIAARGLEAVRMRVREGVATVVDLNLVQGVALSAEFEIQRSERDAAGAKRRLTALLSLTIDLASVELVDSVPEPSIALLEREGLVETTLQARLDLRALDHEVRMADAQVAFERRNKLSEASVSLQGERPDGGGGNLLGPGAAVTLPIFDQNQAQISRAEYRSLELQRTREALACEIGQEVRAALDRARLAARAAVFARDTLIPHAERSLTLARRAYELGDVTILTLLESERTLLQARRTHLDALFESARARNELERVAGTPLD
ncbi:MAG: TolC family protein [Planctomycetota bacterium]|nr:TolC family protein [Planctomycetota bacterium]